MIKNKLFKLIFFSGFVFMGLVYLSGYIYYRRDTLLSIQKKDKLAVSTTIPSITSAPEDHGLLSEFKYLKDRSINGKTYSFKGENDTEDIFGVPIVKPKKFGTIENNQYREVNSNFNYWITSLITGYTKDFWYDEQNGVLFTVDRILPQLESENYETISRYTFEGQGQVNSTAKLLYLNKTGIFSATNIINFFPKENILLLRTRGGDGCGGGGTIWKLNTDGKRIDVQNFGMGCGVTPLKPVLVGYHKDLIYIGLVVKGTNLSPPDEYEINKIISIDPITFEKHIVLNDPKILAGVTYVSFPDETSITSELKESEFILGWNGKYAFDVKTKTLRQLRE